MQRIGKIYLPGGASSRKVMAAFNAASLSPDSVRAFAGSDYLSADCAMSRTTRLIVASRARNEFCNNSFAYGIIKTLADDTIGRGPQIQLIPVDDETASSTRAEAKLQRRERRFQHWCNEVGLAEILRCARVSKAVDGECFIVLAENRGANREIQLQPMLMEPETVRSESIVDTPNEHHDSGQPTEVDGIQYDKYGNPVAYRFLRIHPGENGAFRGDAIVIEAKNVLHYANIYRPHQHRGISEMVAALNIFNDLRRYSTAVVLAAEVAARLSFIISNDLPAEAYEESVVRGDDATDFQSALDIQGGPGRYEDGAFNSLVLPAGYRVSQMQPQQPTNNYVSFRDAKINEAARVFSMPFNVASGNSSSYNYASGRLDHQVYYRSLQIERQRIATKLLLPIFSAWQERDAVLHYQDYKATEEVCPSVMWDGFEHVDPNKEANAQAMRLATGTTTLAEECAREGKDFANVIRQRRREMVMFQESGLPLPSWMQSQQQTKQGTEEKE